MLDNQFEEFILCDECGYVGQNVNI